MLIESLESRRCLLILQTVDVGVERFGLKGENDVTNMRKGCTTLAK